MRHFEFCENYEGKAIMPFRSTIASAGYDFFVPLGSSFLITPGDIAFIHTGIKAKFPVGEVLYIFSRSSVAAKRGIVLANGVGVVDPDYYNNPTNEGNIIIALKNTSSEPQMVLEGERIAQGIFSPFFLVDDDSAVDLRTGGLGSTGK